MSLMDNFIGRSRKPKDIDDEPINMPSNPASGKVDVVVGPVAEEGVTMPELFQPEPGDRRGALKRISAMFAEMDEWEASQNVIIEKKLSIGNDESLSEDERRRKLAEQDALFNEGQTRFDRLQREIATSEAIFGEDYPGRDVILKLYPPQGTPRDSSRKGAVGGIMDGSLITETGRMDLELAPMQEKKQAPQSIDSKMIYNFDPKVVNPDLSIPLDLNVSPEEKAAVKKALANKVDIPILEEATPRYGNTSVDTPSATWLASEREGVGSGARVVEVPFETQAVSSEAIKVEFDLKAMKDKLIIRKKGYDYACEKLNDPENRLDDPKNAFVRKEFQKEVDGSREKYRATLTEATQKLAEMMKSAKGKMADFLKEEAKRVTDELVALDQGGSEGNVSQEKAA
jgi:hypothetical protein